MNELHRIRSPHGPARATLAAVLLLAATAASGQDAPPPAPATPPPLGQIDAGGASPPPLGLPPVPAPLATADPAPGTAIATLPQDLSPWGMFLAADIVVKAVMVGLALASLVTWTVCIAKAVELLVARLRLRRSLRVILGAPDLAVADHALAGRGGPAPAMVRAAQAEATASAEALRDAGGPGLLGRVASHLGRIEARAGRRLGLGTGLLATIGSTAPFVGLFGTVWGIMNAFIGISESQTTNLAVVAPGIAEALLATALGLVAAIPAVVLYNVFARSITGYRALLGDAAAGVERLVSRDLDHRRLAPAGRVRAAE